MICKELYDCKWNPMTLTNYTLYTAAFNVFFFYKTFWADNDLQNSKLVTNTLVNKTQDSCV